ncbi:MAG: hypothetical protein QM519_08440 [Bacteroidia bacterium]|nr:hypothetical protein [Bacteroidia bacterium]
MMRTAPRWITGHSIWGMALAVTLAFAGMPQACARAATSAHKPIADPSAPLERAQAVPAQPAAPEQIPFPFRFGVRSEMLAKRQGVLNQVVLVPDGATYLDEIRQWTIDRRWPVLIEDDHFTPLFLQSFAPERVFRRASVGAMPGGDARSAVIEGAAVHAWTPGAGSMREALAGRGVPSIGVVLYDPADPAWPAALALAAGRGQVLVPLVGNWGAPNDQLDPDRTTALCDAVRDAIAATGLAWSALGDEVDAVSICRSMAGKSTPGERVEFASPFGPARRNEPIATTDALCRIADGRTPRRWAIAGWIFGSEARSAYAAMCSLFLVQKSAWLNDCVAYPSNAGVRQYDVGEATSLLGKAGFAAETIRFSPGGVAAWRHRAAAGWAPDLQFINSMGNVDTFTILQDHDAKVREIPAIGRPMGLHMIHSFSLAAPESPICVGARWLDHGVFAYVGSVHEPMLNAFVPPALVAQRISVGVPLLVAGRWLEGEGDRCWRVQTIGDPLWTPSPGLLRGAIVPAQPREGLVDLKSAAIEAIKAMNAAPTGANALTAMRCVSRLGRPDFAGTVWASAMKAGVAKESAPTALMPLFLWRNLDAVAQAIELIESPTLSQLDLLWTLAAAPLEAGQVANRATIETLVRHPRVPRAWHDMTTVRANAIRVMGNDAYVALNRSVLLQLDADERAGVLENLK